MYNVCKHGTAEIKTENIDFFTDRPETEIDGPIDHVELDEGGDDGLDKVEKLL